MLRWVGPGLIVAAAAVGSGEIVNATRLGAIAGLAVLWTVFWGVFLKGFIQQEIGRYTLAARQNVFRGFGEIPGPRIMGKSWFLWVVVLLLALVILVIIAGIGGTVGGVLAALWPVMGASAWGTLSTLAIIPILLAGTFIPRLDAYRVVEPIMVVMVVGLTLIMVYIAFIGLPLSGVYSYSVADLAGGMTFQLPSGSTLAAVAVLGTIGAGIELIFYSAWLESKGMLRHSHHDGDTPDQRKDRLAAWIRVMKLDTWIGVTATLVVSVAYFITGAVVLNTLGTVPEGVDLVSQASAIFTEILGPGAAILFLVGAFAGLYSTALGVADGTGRMANQLVAEIAPAAQRTERGSVRVYRWAVVVTVLSWIVFYQLVSAPTALIAIGGAALSLLFPLYGAAMLYLNRQLPEQHRMGLPVKLILAFAIVLFVSTWVVGVLFG